MWQTIEPIDWRLIMFHGVNLAADNWREYDEAETWQAMWELLCEAARISRSYEGPPRSGHPTQAIWPECPDDITPWQRQMAYIQGTLDELPDDEPEPPTPNSAEVSRADAVLDLWHTYALRRGEYAHPCKKHIYRLADGDPIGKVMRRSGMTRDAVLAMRKRAATEMLRAAGVS